MRYILYPLTMCLAYLAFYQLQGLSLNSKLISYMIGASVAAFILTMEFLLPYKKNWKPKSGEFLTDALFLFFVQLTLPALLAFSFHKLVSVYSLSINFWPSTWPIFAQTALMLVCAEFLRYILHRASHEWAPLWKLHSIHHAPKKVYWLNTARFHPLEKSFQFCLDSVPFIFLGISEEVLGAYFVFYAVNGFYQHSNIDIKLGPLNYIISGPELHRWHHSINLEEANHNYGNNFILWDLVFGTWYLPNNKEVLGLGVEGADHDNESFLNLLKMPFRRHLKR